MKPTIMSILTALKILLVLLLLAVIVMPIASGYAKIPSSLDPSSVGRFVGQWIEYWITVLKSAAAAIRH